MASWTLGSIDLISQENEISNTMKVILKAILSQESSRILEYLKKVDHSNVNSDVICVDKLFLIEKMKNLDFSLASLNID